MNHTNNTCTHTHAHAHTDSLTHMLTQKNRHLIETRVAQKKRISMKGNHKSEYKHRNRGDVHSLCHLVYCIFSTTTDVTIHNSNREEEKK